VIFVIAPSFQEANDWAYDHAEEYGLTRMRGWRYLHEERQFQGSRDAKLVVLRTFALTQRQLHLVIAARQYLGEGCRL
jgi:hypothetical protein